MKRKMSPTIKHSSDAIRLGYVPLVDSAPFVVAAETGIFRRHGLEVRLQKELGWATIRDKIVYGELDASQAVAGMPFAASLGIGCPPVACVAPMVMNLHGNAITLSSELVRRQVYDPATLREYLRNGGSKPVFGIVSPVSSHRFLLEGWLATGGLASGRDYDTVVVPPPLMSPNLKAGTLDGFCAGEPWNSVAVYEGHGRVITTSPELAAGHPEKVLMMRADTARRSETEVLALVRALVEACRYCESEHMEVARLLSRPAHLNLPVSLVARSLRGNVSGWKDQPQENLHIFSKYEANRPDWAKADWILRHLEQTGYVSGAARTDERKHRRVFREDLFDRAVMETAAGTPQQFAA